MAAMSYLSVIERYKECESLINQLLTSILLGIGDDGLALANSQQGAMEAEMLQLKSMVANYPFVELIYLLDDKGTQISPDIAVKHKQIKPLQSGRLKDRSHRPYFNQLNGDGAVHVTGPYLSYLGDLCLSASLVIGKNHTQKCVLVLDVNLTRLIEYMMGDSARRRFSPLFKSVYSLIVLGLFVLVALLMQTVVLETINLMTGTPGVEDPLQPFSIIIYLTLALAIFDLGKTILEEEVLMHKDIFRHSSTRRTITRFVSTILIAISIEALLTMFKASLGEKQYIEPAIWMLLAVVGLLIGLGVYVYLGAKAEKILTELQADKMAKKS